MSITVNKNNPKHIESIPSRFKNYITRKDYGTIQCALDDIGGCSFLLLTSASHIYTMFEEDKVNNPIKWCERNCKGDFTLFLKTGYEISESYFGTARHWVNSLFLIFHSKADAFAFVLSNDLNLPYYEPEI